MKKQTATQTTQWKFNCILTGLVIVQLSLTSASRADEDSWTKKANMPTVRTAVETVAVDGIIYAIGGRRSTTAVNALSIVEAYDPITDTWTRMADMPTPRMGFGVCTVEGIIYAIGGRTATGTDPLSTVEAYDPETDAWMQKADMPTPRRPGTSAVNGKIYAIGGRGAMIEGFDDYGEDFSVVEEYDPATDTWTRKADMPTARSDPRTCVVNGRIYAIGGHTGIVGPNARIYSLVEVYDPATDTWTTMAPMAVPRSAFNVSAVNGKIYAISGTPFTTYYASVEEYDVATDAWTFKASIPTARSNFGASAAGGKIYVIGGRTSGNVAISTVEVYDTGFALPSPDFNGNGTVDIKDLQRLIEAWGQDEPALDIAPAPFGDGIIDAADLEALMDSWGQEVNDPTLTACWKLDESEGDVAYDNAGINDALVIGDALWQPEGGHVNGAIQLDGINDYVETPFVLNPKEGVFSVFAWINGGMPGQAIVSQVDGADWLLTDAQGRIMTALISEGRRPGDPLFSERVVTDGHWHRIGLVWDGAYRSLYVDDELVATDVELQNSFPSSQEGLTIGAANNHLSGTFWAGLIDDVRIYDRVVKP